ncbi:solute carrier family 16 member 6b isoform X1 [Anguilla anguilla]|uniref:solute carrier family 16 member 6b isoform X1 n=2 Tax=Anguilla anguilla TaxID=7936 RepID=UPI0015A9CE4C|nr:solute carrier family 16 member 6b isoform X1 [Anguilla anguilla]
MRRAMRRALSAGRCLGPKVYAAAPDGDWGWVVAVSFFFVEIFTYGVIKSFGVFLQDLMSEFGETNNRISWVVSISAFVMTFTAPLSSMLSNRFGFRPVVMLGGCLISLGTIATGFTQSVNQMYLTTGIISGLGYCLTFLPTVTILSQYFSRRRSLVTASASTGECFSIFALAPVLTALKERIGWRMCLVVVGVLQGSIIICGALLRPIIIKPTEDEEEEEEGANTPTKDPLEGTYALENEETRTSSDSGVQSLGASHTDLAGERNVPEQRSEEKAPLDPAPGPAPGPARPALLDVSVLRDWSFLCYAMFGLFATLGFFAPQLYIIQLSVSRGVPRETAAYMLSAMAVAEIAGRLSVGCVMNRRGVRKIYVLLACVSLLCVVLALFTAAQGFWGLCACCALYGFLLGTVCSTHIPMLAEDDVVGIHKMSSAAGIYVFIQSFACLGGPPLGGILVDVTQNYGSAFYSCAVGMGIGAVFLGLVRPAKQWQCCTRRVRRQEDGEAAEQAAALQTKQEMPVDFLEVDVAMEPSH